MTVDDIRTQLESMRLEGDRMRTELGVKDEPWTKEGAIGVIILLVLGWATGFIMGWYLYA